VALRLSALTTLPPAPSRKLHPLALPSPRTFPPSLPPLPHPLSSLSSLSSSTSSSFDTPSTSSLSSSEPRGSQRHTGGARAPRERWHCQG